MFKSGVATAAGKANPVVAAQGVDDDVLYTAKFLPRARSTFLHVQHAAAVVLHQDYIRFGSAPNRERAFAEVNRQTQAGVEMLDTQPAD
jgi:hypothetical protein